MRNPAEQLPSPAQSRPVTATVTAPDGRGADDPGISPQDFYREMVERPDVRRILTRLAQIEDGGA